MANRRVLVTGGCGFVGRHLIARLAQEPDGEIRVIDDLSTGQHPSRWERPRTRGLAGSAGGVAEVRLAGTDARILFIQSDFMTVALSELGRIPGPGLQRLPAFDEIYHLASVVGGRNVIDNDPLAVGIDLAVDFGVLPVGRQGREAGADFLTHPRVPPTRSTARRTRRRWHSRNP